MAAVHRLPRSRRRLRRRDRTGRTQLHVGHDGVSERVDGELVSGNFFSVLGVAPAIGRLLTPADDRTPGGHPLAVLGYDYWQRRFAGRRDIVGQKLLVNGHPCTVIGVAARGFYGLEIGAPSHVYVPLTLQPQMGPAWLKLDDRRFHWVQVYARLAPGMTRERAQAGLQPLFSALLELESREDAVKSASADIRKAFLSTRIQVDDASHGQSELRSQLQPSLRILMAVAAGVLLIACANVANLLIARGAARERELALRRALGAGRGRLAWLLLAEAGVLAVAGSVLGLVLATWGAGLLVDIFATSDTTAAVAASPDLRVVAFTACVAILTTLVSGLAPALRAAGGSVAATLKAAGGGVVREQPRLRKSLVVVQVALSFLMVAAAGLFVRSLDNLQQLHPGYATARVASFTVNLERSGYSDGRGIQFGRDALARLAAIPGVDAVGFATFGILEGGGWGMPFTVEGFQPKSGDRVGSMVNAISPGYFETLQAKLLRGRAFGERDARRPAKDEQGWPYRTAIINATFAKRYFPGRDPIGRHVGIGDNPGTATPIEIVGVVEDGKYLAIRENATPQIFLPAFENGSLGSLTVLPAQPAAGAGGARRGARRHRAARSRAAGVQRRHPRRAGGAVAAQRAARGRVVGRLRRAGDAARRRRPLRRHQLHGDAPVARDRDPDGARRPGPARRGAGRPRSRPAGGAGPRRRGTSRLVVEALRRRRALQRAAARPADAGHGRGRPGAHRPGRGGNPGPPRRPRRPDAGAARRVAPTAPKAPRAPVSARASGRPTG